MGHSATCSNVRDLPPEHAMPPPEPADTGDRREQTPHGHQTAACPRGLPGPARRLTQGPLGALRAPRGKREARRRPEAPARSPQDVLTSPCLAPPATGPAQRARRSSSRRAGAPPRGPQQVRAEGALQPLHEACRRPCRGVLGRLGHQVPPRGAGPAPARAELQRALLHAPLQPRGLARVAGVPPEEARHCPEAEAVAHGALAQQRQGDGVGRPGRRLEPNAGERRQRLAAAPVGRLHRGEHLGQAGRVHLRPARPRLEAGLPHGPPARQRAAVVDGHRPEGPARAAGWLALEEQIARVPISVAQSEVEAGDFLDREDGHHAGRPGEVSRHPEVLRGASHVAHKLLDGTRADAAGKVAAAALGGRRRTIKHAPRHLRARGHGHPGGGAREAVEHVGRLLAQGASAGRYPAALEPLLGPRLEYGERAPTLRLGVRHRVHASGLASLQLGELLA
mmetsp:Transcript_53457/g.141921  ORF Transcript_53457/g.141921 Transcript_53457/m.141921 type:complete len:452 (-) Transcript_53457:245-1600(-)